MLPQGHTIWVYGKGEWWLRSSLSLSLCCYNSNRNWPRLYPKQNIQEFVQELAPVFRDFIWGLLQFPDALKASHHSGLRAIYGLSLWRVPLQGFGGFYPCRLIAQVSHQIDPRQYARAGHSPAGALVHLLQAVYEAADTENCGVRLFSADYSNGFDMIDHSICRHFLEV